MNIKNLCRIYYLNLKDIFLKETIKTEGINYINYQMRAYIFNSYIILL